ncbi:hypothetical protein GKZ28_25165 [Clostridium chromiireducens]|uniref:Uncharacterized protein n=1 Tax=Clostridium chromiireducens TaxID=225345 RepID=A0A964W4W2_9CLOT|nr:hypothetical protein [Clostridium chromiireducens]MVX66951.1 hypothetical protein [Clostridium chromiireducens]
MNELIIAAVRKMEEVRNQMGKEYTWENINGTKMECEDYSKKRIPVEIVKDNKQKILKILDDFYLESIKNNRIDDFAILYAIYCNIYIKWGFYTRLDKDITEHYFSLEKYINNNEWANYFKNILCGVRDQDYTYFEAIIKERPQSPIANLYLFVKSATDFCYGLVTKSKISSIEDKMWSYYEWLDPDLKKYALGEGKYYNQVSNLAADENFLPYVNFKSVREFLNEYVVGYYENILDNLGIDKIEDDNKVFNQIVDKLQINKPMETIKALADISAKIKNEYNLNNIDDFKKSMPYVLSLYQKLIDDISNGYDIFNKNYFSFRFIIEKLNCLATTPEEVWIQNSNFENEISLDEADCLVERNAYLHIPVTPYNIAKEYFIQIYKTFTEKKEKEEAKQKLIELNKQRIEIMDYYAHSWRHISYPQTVKDVADELINEGKISLGNKLHCVYDSETTLQNGIKLVQYMISENKDEIKNHFEESIYRINATAGMDIKSLIERSLNIVMFKIFMQGVDNSTKIDSCKKLLQNKKDFEVLSQNYFDTFIGNKKNDTLIIEWFNNNVYSLKVCLCNDWQVVRLIENDFAQAQLTQIFVEFFTNAIMHGDSENGIELNLTSDDKIMRINMKNSFNEERGNGSQKGIKTLKNILDKINMSPYINSLNKEENNNIFSITASFAKGIIYKKGWR